MRKALMPIFKNMSALGTVIGLWILYALMVTAGAGPLLSGLTVVVFITVLALFVEDAFEKAFGDPQKFTWQYFLLGLFVAITDLLWLFFADCSTWLQFTLRLVILLAGIAGTAAWYLFAYRPSVLSEEERNLLALIRAYKKVAKTFPKLDDEGVRDALKETLFCRLSGDSLEGSLVVDKPFTADCRTYADLSGSSDLGAQERASAMSVISAYIDRLVAGRKKDEASSKQ